MGRRSRIAKLAAWICLLAILCVPPGVARVEIPLHALGIPEPFFVPDSCFSAPPLPQALALPSDAGRAPPRS